MHSHKHTNNTEQLCSQEIQKSYTKCYFEDILHITIYHSVKAPNTNIMPTVQKHRRNRFGATVCKTVCPMLSDRCLSVCLSVTFVHCGQTVGRIKMKLGIQVGLGRGHIVLDPAPPPPKGHSPPIFGTYLLRPNGCMDQCRSLVCILWARVQPTEDPYAEVFL